MFYQFFSILNKDFCFKRNLKKSMLVSHLRFHNFNNRYKFKNITVVKGADGLDGLYTIYDKKKNNNKRK